MPDRPTLSGVSTHLTAHRYRVELTRGEASAIRLAMIFGQPDQGHPDLDSAMAKLRKVEERAARRDRE